MGGFVLVANSLWIASHSGFTPLLMLFGWRCRRPHRLFLSFTRFTDCETDSLAVVRVLDALGQTFQQDGQ